MKKLLLVLMVVAMASFLLVGCLPGVTPDPTPDPDPEPTPTPVTIAVDKEYTNVAGVTFVACGKDVIVTLPTAVETDYVVYVAQKVETAGVITYENKVAATPNADRTVWTAKAYTIVPLEGECKPICLVALVKHPCCPGEEVALRVVTVDCEAPYADLAVTFKDCYDPCVDPPDCPPFPVPGAYFEFSSRTAGECITTDCCGDDCSGFASWELVIDPDPCAAACDTVSGSACPVEGILDCGCLPYATGVAVGTDLNLTETYKVTYTLLDNVGNKFTEDWTITVDTDEVITFDGGDLTSAAVTMGTALYVYTGNCAAE